VLRRANGLASADVPNFRRYDIIIDSDLKPWLIEVNASPSLSSTTISDRILKYTMIDDALRLMVPDGDIPSIKKKAEAEPTDVGSFELLYDESLVSSGSDIRSGKGGARRRPPSAVSQWK